MINMPSAPQQKPETFNELFSFYHDYVKVLYSLVQTENALPDAVLFELNAALDHMSRHWTAGQSEKDVVDKMFSHLKRSCLDIFKIQVKEARREYDALLEIDTSTVDNGEFDKKRNELFNQIRSGATKARQAEGIGNIDEAFSTWEDVLANCLRFHEELFLHDSLTWAKKTWWSKYWKSTLFSSLTTFITGLIAGLIIHKYGDQIYLTLAQIF